jgi:hypothetical protein
MKGRPAAAETSTKTMSTAVPATAMPAADFDRQSVGGDVGRGRSTRVDRRQRLRAFAARG